MGRKSCHQIAGALLVLVVFSCFAGCGSVPKASLAGNFYTYDYELLLSFTESSYLYQQSAGMRMYQDYTKTASNVVVQMQDSGFVEPDYGYLLEISPSGRISSRDNASVTGKYHDDGTFYWQGVEESGGVLRNLLVRGKLLPSRAQDRADSRYDGSFVLTDPGTGREQQVLVQDGLYFWHYAQPKEDDFEPWPLVVQPDGTIVYSLEMITRSGMVGMYDMTFSSEVYTSGQVELDGSISVSSITKTLGTGMMAPQEAKVNYVATSGSQQLQEKLGQEMGRILAGGTKSASKNLSGGGRKNPPHLWFVADLDTSTDVVAGRGMKWHEDRAVALELAEAAAVAEAISAISITVARESRGYETNQERRLYEVVETVASRSHDYRVVNSLYDSESSTAYVMVEMEVE
ncbi:MAG: hypothetical protein IJW57_01900 [Spirochaetaceae bacterium]|nr:hypothetical protein [Spirochaetaceae bacterium]